MAAVTLSAEGLGACGGQRERLDVPQLSLDVPDQAPPPGGRITGHVAASDASGLTFLFVYACTADSVFRQGADLDREHSVGFDFALHVAGTAVEGEEVEVYAVANDDQGFYADTARALVVGAPAAASAARAKRVSPTNAVAGSTAPLCPRVIRTRRVRAAGARPDAPTAPRP